MIAAKVLDKLILVFLCSSGLMHTDPVVFYKTWLWVFAGSMITHYVAAIIFQKIFSVLGRRIQTSKNSKKELYFKQFTDTFFGFGLVVASIISWPMANSELGFPTGVLTNLDDCLPSFLSSWPYYAKVFVYLCKALFAMLLADAYNYWKHRLFHTKYLWPFHKTHHAHHNPSTLSSYAVSAAYGFFTFCPIYAFIWPFIGVYMPLHLPFMAFYFFLNHYLHCGYVIDVLETVMSPFYIISSGWHNVHHEKGRPGSDYKEQTFSEMFIVWDLLCGTYPRSRDTNVR